MLSKEVKDQIIQDYMLHEGDTGSPEVQIALLTYRINSVNEHLKANKKIIIQEEDCWKWLDKEEDLWSIYKKVIL